jgi:hypothetical protein
MQNTGKKLIPWVKVCGKCLALHQEAQTHYGKYMKVLICLITILIVFKADANDKFVAKDMIESASEIIWYNCDNGEGIFYAKFEAFVKLKKTLIGIVSSEPVGEYVDLDHQANYSFLYFKVELPEPRYRVAALLDDTLIIDKKIYGFEKTIMDNWHYHNNKRIVNNEAVKLIIREANDVKLNYCGIAKREN